MAYIDSNILTEYPFHGVFYTVSDNMPEDGDMLDEEQDMEPDETIVTSTMCDIQAANKLFATSEAAGSYVDVYFPFDKRHGVDIRIGHRFRCKDWYRPVDGKVIGVMPTQMGGCVANVKEVGVDE